MKEYDVSYYLHDMYHSIIVEGLNEVDAIKNALHRIPERNHPFLHDFKIKRYFREWN